MKRFVALSVLLLSLVAVKTEAAIILVFGQNTGLNLFTGNETGGVTTLDANSIPVIITTLDENPVSINAFFSLDAVSTAGVTNIGGNVYTQPYSGTFSILSGGGFNYLSGVFDGIDLGIDGGTTMVFGSTDPPLLLNFTSMVAGMSLSDPSAMALALTNITPGVSIVNNSFGDFTSSVAGNFSAQDASVVPEPASLLLMGTGLSFLAARRRKKLAKKV